MKIKSMLLILVVVLLLTACGGGSEKSEEANYKDGVYTGTYSEKEGVVNMEVVLTIESNKITECAMKSYGKDGKLKDETYGDGLDDKNKELAKLAYQGFTQYPSLLVENQDVNKIDAISGATVSYKEFKSAVEDALKQAKK